MKAEIKPRRHRRVGNIRKRRMHWLIAPHVKHQFTADVQLTADRPADTYQESIPQGIVTTSKEAVTPACTSTHAFDNNIQGSALSPSQQEIDAEALAIAKRQIQRHAKTWTELAKY